MGKALPTALEFCGRTVAQLGCHTARARDARGPAKEGPGYVFACKTPGRVERGPPPHEYGPAFPIFWIFWAAVSWDFLGFSRSA
jgi:hypothetical protein